jgi:hypothetical protein
MTLAALGGAGLPATEHSLLGLVGGVAPPVAWLAGCCALQSATAARLGAVR